MNNGAVLFFGILVTLATSFWGLILAPQLQFGRQQPRVIEATGEIYPAPRPGLAERGADVYRSLGCVECHSQQVRQTGVSFDVWVTELTTNMSAAVQQVAKLSTGLDESAASKTLASLPAKMASGLKVEAAQILARQLTEAGAKAEPALVVHGPDIERNWGRRMNVSPDYLRDYPVQLGQLRLGPDLANYGARQSAALTNQALQKLILQHLYEPESTMPGSMMPPYRFLFEERKIEADSTAPGVDGFALATKPGVTIVPTEDAIALLSYLLSLRAETSLFEAPAGKEMGKAPSTAAASGAAPAP